MLRAASSSESFFRVAGLICGPLPSWSVEPDPAIKSATGGLSTPGGTFRNASMAPTRILLSWADALAARPRAETTASAARIVCMVVASIDLASLFRQHDRNAVADRISELCRARDQFLFHGVVLERSL